MPPKHANAGRLLQRGLYDDLPSFTELEERISALGDENTKIVGEIFGVVGEVGPATCYNFNVVVCPESVKATFARKRQFLELSRA